MTSPRFTPQALADPATRSVLVVFVTEDQFAPWRDKIKTIDAPGVAVHPRLIKIGDTIDWYITGWNKCAVESVKFNPDGNDIPEFHRSGTFTFKVQSGFISIRIDGRNVLGAPIFVFPQ